MRRPFFSPRMAASKADLDYVSGTQVYLRDWRIVDADLGLVVHSMSLDWSQSMSKIILTALALAAPVGAASCQAPDPPIEAAKQALGLFAGSCLRFADNVTDLRAFMITQNVRELTAQERVSTSGAVEYEAVTDVTRLRLISHDDGVCGVMAERAVAATILGLVEDAIKRPSVAVTAQRKEDVGYAHTNLYDLTIGDRRYTLSVGDNAMPSFPMVSLVLFARLP